ncbi:MAG: radical SAM protein, partial [Clostridiales Family XIII bacterium]|nr:radical SAM protein [Clostridiales Family XIII bacterium]
CAISQYYRCRYYKRDIEDILRDVSLSPHKYHFLVDDNLTADKAHAEALFSALTPHRIKWAGQGTLAMASDPAFLKAMKKSGCELILIGFESLEEESLRQMKKGFMTGLAQGESVRRIHDAGIGIYATFVMGYDGDTPATIERTVAFAEKHKFYTAAFNHLLPYPGTQLYRDLQQGGRLLHDAWWLAEDYNYGELAFRPKHFTPEELSRRCHEARREFSAGSVVLRRGLHAMRHTSPLMWSLFWAMNLRLGTEVDEKMNVPIGENLDELPK